MTVPDGLIKEVFQRALDALLPAGPPARRAVLAGPGQPALDADVDVLLAPAHPQTGGKAGLRPTRPPRHTWWRCRSGCGCGWPSPSRACPFLRRAACLTVSSATNRPCRARYLFRAGPGAFQHTLVRLPVVRSPWLREILENLTQHMRTRLF